MKMKYINAVIGIVVTCCLQCFGGDYKGVQDSRNQNTDGDVFVKYDREGGGKFIPGFDLSIQAEGKAYPKLKLDGLYFVDAKVDKNNDVVAVVYDNGTVLFYGCYVLTNRAWKLERGVSLAESSVAFNMNCNRLELENFNTFRISFIPAGQTFRSKNGRKAGIEQAGDIVYHFRVLENGEVMVNDKKWEGFLWRPDIGKVGVPSIETNSSTQASPPK